MPQNPNNLIRILSENSAFSPFVKFINLDSSIEQSTSSINLDSSIEQSTSSIKLDSSIEQSTSSIKLDSSTEQSTSSSLGDYSAEMAEIHEAYLSSPEAKSLELRETLLKIRQDVLARKENLAQEEKILELKDRVEAVDTAKLPEEPFFSAPSEIQELVQVIQSGIAEAPSVVDQVATLLTS